jgi:hypothetical protein
VGIVKTYQLESMDAGQAACVDFYRKHRRLPDDCGDEDMVGCLSSATKYMNTWGWRRVDDRMRSDLEDAICTALEYWE